MIIEQIIKPKRLFNERSKKDLALAKHFIQNNSWGKDGCPFILEFPYLTIPDMIKDKITHKAFGLKFSRYHHWE